MKPVQTWINEQARLSISQFELAMSNREADALNYLANPEKYYHRIAHESNYIDAIKIFDWNKYLSKNANVLDLGGGSGWLSAFLSKYENVEKISLIDSSKYFLEKMAPGIFKIMNGIESKIERIEGLFAPLLVPDETYDVVVICSSLHHAENMEALLIELHRVIKKSGWLIVLNETPFSNVAYFKAVTRVYLSIAKNTMLKRYKIQAPAISSSGFLYDAILGDRMYPLWYWKKAFYKINFRVDKIINTKMVSLKNGKGPELYHFLCQKV